MLYRVRYYILEIKDNNSFVIRIYLMYNLSKKLFNVLFQYPRKV